MSTPKRLTAVLLLLLVGVAQTPSDGTTVRHREDTICYIATFFNEQQADTIALDLFHHPLPFNEMRGDVSYLVPAFPDFLLCTKGPDPTAKGGP